MRVVFVGMALFLASCSEHLATSPGSFPSSPGGATGADDDVRAGAGGVDEVSDGGASVAEAGAPTLSLSFTHGELPDAQVGRNYEYTFNATGTAGPVEYAILGDHLPAGLSMSRTGVLSGVPNEPGEFILKIEATAAGASIDAEFQLDVMTNAWLVYRSDDRTPAQNELFAVNAGTKAPHTAVTVSHALANGDQVSGEFSWSPDGSYLAYASEGAARHDVYVVDMRGLVPSTPISLSATLADVRLTGSHYLRWSPDSKALFVDGGAESFVVELAEGVPIRARPIPIGMYCWKWTPDSQTLLCRDGAQTSVVALPRDASASTTLTGALAVGSGNLTPDGTKLVFEDEDGSLYFSRLTDTAPRPIRIGRVPLGSLVAKSRPSNDTLIYVASNVRLGEHEIYRASLSDEPRVEALVSAIDTSASGMDYRDINAALLPGEKILTYRGKGLDEGSLELNVRVLATGQERSFQIRSDAYPSFSNDGTFALVPELQNGGDYLNRCRIADDGLQLCIGLNRLEPGFQSTFASMSPKNDGVFFIGSTSGQPRKAFYSDMRGDIRPAVPLNDEGDALPLSSSSFGPDGSKIALSLVSNNMTSMYLVDVAQQRPIAPEKVSGKGLVTAWAWQPR